MITRSVSQQPGGLAAAIASLVLLATGWTGRGAVSADVPDAINPLGAVATTTTLASDTNPAIFGAKIVLTATVDPDTATGTVEFFEGATSLGSSALGGGTATISISTLGVGTHPLTATYAGDSAHAGSTSEVLSQVVQKAPTSTALDDSPDPSDCGGGVTLTATVTPIGATGTVEFRDGATVLGSSALSDSGTASITVSGLSLGAHSLSATYGGDGSYLGSGSGSVPHQVRSVPTGVVLDAPTVSACVDAETLTATVTPSGATGSVEFFAGATSLGSRPLGPDGVVTVEVSGLAVGTHSLTASYGGDACHDPAVSSPVSHQVNPVSTSIVLDGPAKSDCGNSVLLTATVTPAGGTGKVQFFDRATSLAIRTIEPDGVVVVSIPGLSVGAHELFASYLGDGCYQPSSSDSVSHQVNPVTGAISLDVGPAKTACGDDVTFTAVVTPAGATGIVEFLDGTTSLAIRPLDPSGTASLTLAGLSPGWHSITARYGGNECRPAIVSDTVLIEVNPLPTSTAIEIAPDSAVCGQKVMLTATLTPATATGAVQFFDGGQPIGPEIAVSRGVAQLSTFSPGVGPHALSAAYGGGGCDGPSQSDTLGLVVERAPSQTAVGSDNNPAKLGTDVTLTATVTPPGAGGSVSFTEAGNTLGTAMLDATGTARVVVSGLSLGDHPVTATYEGDSCFAASVSAVLVQRVVADQAPAVQVDAPNGGETLVVGSQTKLAWTATDDHGVASVDLWVSRDRGASYDTIAAGLANDGTFTWTVTGPGTNSGSDPVFSALLRVVARDVAGNAGTDTSDAPFSIHQETVSVTGESIAGLFLAPPTPNPTGGATRIEFSLPRAGRVRLAVWDLQGRQVAALVDGMLPAGRHQAVWSGITESGEAPVGLYFLRLVAGDRTRSRRLVVAR